MVVTGTTPTMGRVAHDFSKNPMLVYWEMTQACGLACKHCRAEAMPTAHPLELTTEESRRFLSQLVGFGDPLPHLILTGGDPLSRKDIYLSMERNMKCAVGSCGHCQYGPHFICKEGPVFPYETIRTLLDKYEL